MITAEQARELLSYDEDTGVITWRVSRGCVKAGDIARYVGNGGYPRVRINLRLYMAHRVAWLLMTGEWPEQEVDHINGIRIDNRWCNLRGVSRQENQRNASTPSTNTSGIIGVYWRKDAGKWCAQIMVNGIGLHLGLFPSAEEAAEARKAAEKKYGFHKNHGRAIQ